MNFDKVFKNILGKSKLNSLNSRLSYKGYKQGASISVQNQWKSFSSLKKRNLLKKYPDSDRDGVPNKWDCQPRNPFKQGWAHKGHTFNREETTNVKMMSPDKFLRTTHKEMEGRNLNESYEDYKKSIFQEGSRENIEKLKNVIKSKKGKMEIPYLLYDTEGRPTAHEGRHRAQASKELGIKLMPVTIGRKLTPSNYRDWKNIRSKLGAEEDWRLELENEERVTSSKSADIPIKEQREYGKEKPEVLQFLNEGVIYEPLKEMMEDFKANPKGKSQGRCHDAASYIVTDAKRKGIPESELDVIGVTRGSGSHVVAKVRDTYYDPTKTQFGVEEGIISKELDKSYNQATSFGAKPYFSNKKLEEFSNLPSKEKIENAKEEDKKNFEPKPHPDDIPFTEEEKRKQKLMEEYTKMKRETDRKIHKEWEEKYKDDIEEEK